MLKVRKLKVRKIESSRFVLYPEFRFKNNSMKNLNINLKEKKQIQKKIFYIQVQGCRVSRTRIIEKHRCNMRLVRWI
jgi:hypothetical protein